jgi:hypothetical protein
VPPQKGSDPLGCHGGHRLCPADELPYSRIEGHVLTPKFGKESDLWVRFDKESVWWKEGFFQRYSAKRSAVGYLLRIRQRNSRADFAGLDDDVAQSGETNGWIGDQA